MNPLPPHELIGNIDDAESKPEKEETTEDEKTFDSTIINHILPANSTIINNNNSNVDQISNIILVEYSKLVVRQRYLNLQSTYLFLYRLNTF